MFTFARMFNTRETEPFLTGEGCVSCPGVLPSLLCLYCREILLHFFPEYQLPPDFGYTSLEELIASSEVSWLFGILREYPAFNP